MNYFSQDDHNAVISISAEGAQGATSLQQVYNRMTNLHRNLSSRLKSHGYTLHTNPAMPMGVGQSSIVAPNNGDTMTLTYMRSQTDAMVVERVMGRDELTQSGAEVQRHPVIELRLTPDHFVAELVVGPEAWYDQRNFLGKFTIKEHRHQLFKLLTNLDDEYCVGFWSGLHLNDMHLSTRRLPPPHILFDFIETFAAGRDYLRIGRWYDVGDPSLNEDTIVHELFNRVRDLYDIYEYILWTSNNNFHTFFERAYIAVR